MPVSETKKLDKIISSLIENQSSIISKISGMASYKDSSITLIDSFENYTPLSSGLYISNSDISELQEIRYYDENHGWIKISKSTNKIDAFASETTFPTSKAVYNLFQEVSKDILNTKEVFYLNSYFSNNFMPNISGLYVDLNGETRFYPEANSEEFESISREVKDVIHNDESLNENNSIPTTLAVYKFAKNLSSLILDNVSFDTSVLDNYALLSDLKYISGELSGKVDDIDLNNYAPLSDLKHVSGQLLDKANVSDLSGYISKNDLNNYVTKDDIDGTKEVFYLNTYFTDSFVPTISGLYVDTNGETRFYPEANNAIYEEISKNIDNVIFTEESLNNDETIPTTLAVYKFVQSVSGNISNNGGDSFNEEILNNYATKDDLNKYALTSSLSGYATKDDLNGTKEVIFVNGYFGDNYKATTSGIFIDGNGEVRLYSISGYEYTNLSYPISDNILSELNEEEPHVPTTLSVYKFVQTVSGNILANDSFNEEILNDYVKNETFQEFVSGSTIFDPSILNDYATKDDLNEYVLTSSLSGYATKDDLNGTKEVTYISGLFGDNYKATCSGVFLDKNGESRLYSTSGYEYITMSYPISESITLNNDSSIPTTNAVYKFVNEEKDVVTAISSTFDEFIPTTNGLYIDSNNKVKYFNEDSNLDLSMEVVDDLTDENNISDSKVASTMAIINYIKILEDRIKILEEKLNS